MDFAYSPKVKDLAARVTRFMDENVYPAEPVFAAEVEANRKRGNAWVPTKVMEELKAEARAAGLWNLFLPESNLGAGLTNLEYAPLCEIMNLSITPPYRSTTGTRRSNRPFTRSRTFSESNCSDISAKPDTSTNTTVTTLCSLR